MPTGDEWNAYGSILAAGDSSNGLSTVYTPVAAVETVSGGGWGGGTFPTTSNNTPAGFGTVVPSKIKTHKDMRVTVFFLPTDPTQNDSTGLISMVADNVLHDFQWQWADPDTTIEEFSAYVLDWEPQLPLDGPAKAVFVMRAQGVPSIT